ncbi:glycosyl transferase family 2 [Bowdeniella nasicola]|uniref:Glucosyl-3-phosphoglycerate synthase n=1 Tax=Bowdeniella nasicola TaxID=208480 RepID=A0A1Q5Q184_9ACTO|nr:glycosyltransferase family 2 protein [Bowdeniella nasicola]OKL53624.1 glycosyl transferase family 2 [Bowdeniella nasicola]
MSPDPTRRVAVVIPAKNEAASIATTIRAARAIQRVDLVIVVDDGSEDGTQHVARNAGAAVVRHAVNRGKASAMETGAAVVAMRDIDNRPPRHLLFLDADLGESAVECTNLVTPVLEDVAQLTIAALPPQQGAAGRGIVVGAARKAIEKFTGWQPTQPLSGQRCITREAYEVATPLSRGWGVETGMTIDVLRAGMTVMEVPCDLTHRATSNDIAGQLHRAAQYRDVMLAVTQRRIRSRTIPSEIIAQAAALQRPGEPYRLNLRGASLPN